MKHYDREKKKWVDEDILKLARKKKEKCRGGKEHDWVEVLPYGVEALDGYKGDPTPYYVAEQKIDEFIEKMYLELEQKHKILRLRRFAKIISRYRVRHYQCSVCNKQRTEYYNENKK